MRHHNVARTVAGLVQPLVAVQLPLASPIAEDLRGMPPVMIHAGADELLIGDAELMTDRLRDSGVPCALHLWAGQVHDFAVAGNATPEIRAAIKMIGRFVQDVTAQHRSRPPTPGHGIGGGLLTLKPANALVYSAMEDWRQQMESAVRITQGRKIFGDGLRNDLNVSPHRGS
jgi:hypothetical protein